MDAGACPSPQSPRPHCHPLESFRRPAWPTPAVPLSAALVCCFSGCSAQTLSVPPSERPVGFPAALSQAQTRGRTLCNLMAGENVGEILRRAILGVEFLRTRVFRNTRLESDPSWCCHPLRTLNFTFAPAFDAVGGFHQVCVISADLHRRGKEGLAAYFAYVRALFAYTPSVPTPCPASARVEGSPFNSHPLSYPALSRPSLCPQTLFTVSRA